MKKIVLLVASILATLNSIASRSSNNPNNPLILSPSDGIYNHGSHASHWSHTSHFSASNKSNIITNNTPAINVITNNTPAIQQTSYFTKVELDSLGELSGKQKKYAIKKVSTDWGEDKKNVHLKTSYYAYVLSVKAHNGLKVTAEKLFPKKSKSIYLEFTNGNWYVIPLSAGEYIIRGTSSSFVEVPKSDWMSKLTKIQ